MWAVYFVTGFILLWMALGTWGPLHSVDPYPFAFLLFLGNVAELMLLSIILVGQAVLGAAADKRALQTYRDAEAILHEVVRLHRHLMEQDKILNQGVALVELSWIRSADLLVQSDDDAFRPADVGEPIRVPVLHHVAHELGPVGAQARDDSVDVIDGEHDATDAQCVHRRLHGPKPDRVGRVELVELDAAVAVRGPQEREGGANVLESDQAVDRRSLDLRLAFELEAEFDEERLGRLEVVDNDENVVHPPNRHIAGGYG